MNNTPAPTLQKLALDRMRQQRAAQQSKQATAQAEATRMRQSYGAVRRIFQRDILQGAKLPADTRIESIIHGHHIENDSLVVPVFGGLIQRWIADKGNVGGVRQKVLDDFLDAFIWLFRSELEAKWSKNNDQT